jgi:hypothetical protein
MQRIKFGNKSLIMLMNITVIGWFNLSGFFLLRIFCFFRDAFFFFNWETWNWELGQSWVKEFDVGFFSFLGACHNFVLVRALIVFFSRGVYGRFVFQQDTTYPTYCSYFFATDGVLVILSLLPLYHTFFFFTHPIPKPPVSVVFNVITCLLTIGRMAVPGLAEGKLREVEGVSAEELWGD